MRGAFLKQGVDPNKDIQFINIPNPSDHLAALQRGGGRHDLLGGAVRLADPACRRRQALRAAL